MTRAERYAQVKALRDQGLLLRQISAETGLAVSTVGDLLSDPTGDKARERKRRYERGCLDCGKTINPNGNGPHAAKRCVLCAARHAGAERKVWSQDALIEAIQRWVEIHGEPPRRNNWCASAARAIGHPEMAADGYVSRKAGEWPGFMAVVRAFGSWNGGIAAAGFKPRPANHAGKEVA